MQKKPGKQNGSEAEPRDDLDVGEDVEIKVTDRRHWAVEGADEEEAETPSTRPTVIDEYRQRTEAAETKLQEYIEAHKQFRTEQEAVRVRLTRDIERRVDLKFGEMVRELLETVDNLDLALNHVDGVPEASPLAHGVRLARDRFLSTLERNGVEKISPDDQPFDPNEAEAVRVDPVQDKDQDGRVTETLQPGYRLGDCLIRPARVAVGRAV